MEPVRPVPPRAEGAGTPGGQIGSALTSGGPET